MPCRRRPTRKAWGIGPQDGPIAPLPAVVVPVDPRLEGEAVAGGEGLGGLGDDGPQDAFAPLGGIGEEPSDLEAEEIVVPRDQ
ncbi:MAG: hypothetical protein R6X03_10160, partial [Methyloceanibacter sp.]